MFPRMKNAFRSRGLAVFMPLAGLILTPWAAPAQPGNAQIAKPAGMITSAAVAVCAAAWQAPASPGCQRQISSPKMRSVVEGYWVRE